MIMSVGCKFILFNLKMFFLCSRWGPEPQCMPFGKNH
nr:MAG TPA: hypothetical protein [Caudoviricetes sp.]